MSTSTAVSTVTLKVAEGRSQDVGRGLARLDPVDMSRLGAGAGSVVQITGKKVTAVRVMPAYRDARGNEVVQIDSITRSNAGAIIGEKVTLTVIEAVPAQRVVLIPEGAHNLRPLSGEHVGKL